MSGYEGRGHGSYGTSVVEMIEALKACLLGARRNAVFNGAGVRAKGGLSRQRE